MSIPFRFALAAACLAAAGSPLSLSAAGLLVPADGGSPLAITSHEVAVEIHDGIAVTEITQVFRNDGPEPLEAVYSFPLPPAASLSGFSMWIAGEEMSGEVVERVKARRLYDEIAHPTIDRQPITPLADPGLVEEVGHRDFRAAIFPVPAHGTQKIRLTYVQHLLAESDLLTYVYPLETRSPESSRAEERFQLHVSLRSSVPVAGYAFPGGLDEVVTTEIFHDRRMDVSMDREDGGLDRDFLMVWRLAREQPGLDLRTWKQPGQDGFFLLLATAPDEEPGPAGPVDWTFLVDVSGSMRRGGRLDLAGRALERFLEAAQEADRCNAVVFNREPEALSPTPLPNGPASRRLLRELISHRPGIGRAELYDALALALDLADPARETAVVVVSDGGLAPAAADHDRYLDLLEGRGIRIFGLALGHEADLPLLESLAHATGGFTAWLSSRDDLDRRGALLRARMRRTPWRDLELTVDGPVEILDLARAQPVDLWPGAQQAILGRWRGAGSATFRLEGTRNGAPALLEGEFHIPAQSDDAPEIRRVWAEARIDDLLRRKRRRGFLSEAEKRAVVELGERWSIVTPLTSFLVLETDEEFRSADIPRRSRALLEQEAAAREDRAEAAAALPVASSQRKVRDLDWGGGAVGPGLVGGALLLLLSPLFGAGRRRPPCPR